MKNSSKTKIILCIVFLLISFVILACGIILDYLWMTILGGVLLGLSVVLYIIVLNLPIFRYVRNKSQQHLQSEDIRNSEETIIEEVNNSCGLENCASMSVYRTFNIKQTWKSVGLGEKICISLVVTIVLLGMITFVVLMCLRLFIPMAIVLGCLFVLVLTVIMMSRIIAKRSISQDGIDYVIEPVEGIVVACWLISDTTTSTRGMRLSSEKTRIKKVFYKLRVIVSGKEIITYSKRMYNEGEKVQLRQHKKKANVYIIDE